MADSELQKEFERRYQKASEARDLVWGDIKEVYHFCLDGSAEAPDKATCKTDIFDELPAQLAEDFASDLATYFVPEYAEWINFTAGSDIDPDYEDEAAESVEERKAVIMSELAVSNFYDVVPVTFQDAAHGTCAFWMHDIGPSEPLAFEPIHISELTINLGRFGRLDDRFRTRTVSWEYLFDTYPDLKNDQKFKLKLKNAATQSGALIEGFWRDKDDQSGRWRSVVAVDKRVVEHDTIDGIEHVPLVVGRFRPSPGKPWGYGPGRRALATMRTYNEVSRMMMENMDSAMNPAFAQSGANPMDDVFEEGIEGGRVYNIPVGSSISQLSRAGDLNTGMFSMEAFETKLRAAFFQDGPRQKGLTPPSASQWLDEARRIQKRMGRPASPIYGEMIVHLIKRMDQVLVARGRIAKDVKYDGKMVSLEPINPLTFAQRQEEVVTARALLSDIFTFDPQGASMLVDMPATFGSLKVALGDRLVKIKSQDQIQADQAALMQQQALAQGGQIG